ncbi:MAG TPA: NAD-dependent epimerase/dehydratase family protein [Chloroflexota bacterium]|nr:NAD-dependent epimerase/dehydratase family protein [Chloroflexota bacterium]
MTTGYEQFYYGRRVTVTGGLGFVGSNLGRRLVDLGADVLLIDVLAPEYGGNLHNVHDICERVRINIADVRTEWSMRYLVKGQDLIFNLAGQVSHIDSMTDPRTDLEINCRAQLTLLEACRRENPGVKLVYASTRQIYGRPSYLPLDEKHLVKPTDVNGINKAAGEQYHLLYNDVYGVRASALRLTNTYGPRMLMSHARQGFLPWFVRLALDGQEIGLFGDGTQLRDLTYVDDAVDAFLRAGAMDAANGEAFNLGGLRPYSLREIADTIVRLVGRGSVTAVPFPAEQKAIDVGSVYSDHRKIEQALGWQPTVDLEEGLRRMIDYYRVHRDHYWPCPATASETEGERTRADPVQRPEAAAPEPSR